MIVVLQTSLMFCLIFHKTSTNSFFCNTLVVATPYDSVGNAKEVNIIMQIKCTCPCVMKLVFTDIYISLR